MLIQLLILFGLFLFGFLLFEIAEYYSRRYLGFNSVDHNPVCTPSSSSAPTLVCVLGWGGCKRRQLRRLVEFYSSQGIPTVSWINPMYNYLFGVDIKQVERVLDFMIHENRSSKNIIIHLHSNNGTLVWHYMLQLMDTNEHYNQLLAHIKGVIFDSAPLIHAGAANWLVQSAFGASLPCVSIIIHQPRYFHIVWSPLMMYYLFIKFFYIRYFSSDPLSPADKIADLLRRIPTDIRQNYLYSTNDRLIPSKCIEKIMTEQTERDVHVTSHRFTDSGHVNHFRLHPEEYGKLILAFIHSIQKAR